MTYGFAAICNNVKPKAKINKAVKKKPKDSICAAGKNKNVPTAEINSPNKIPFLYPILLMGSPDMEEIIK